MTKRMLIDSTHAEETRVVVLDGNRLEDYDVETSTKQQLKGNIYLAKIVRVEPSLQAAFVEFGGGRHGFLAFGEIHPDYYQIPVADRKRLLEMQEAEAREEEEEEEREAARRERGGAPRERAEALEIQVPEEPVAEDTGHEEARDDIAAAEAEPAAADAIAEAGYAVQADPETAQALAIEQDIIVAPLETVTEAVEGADLAPEIAESVAAAAESPVLALDDAAAPAAADPDHNDTEADPALHGEAHAEDHAEDHAGDHEVIPPNAAPEHIGGELDVDDRPDRRQPSRFLRNYKIQEVMRRRQILLVQVVKEERGTKGAALTTYISLAGRFSVLMPNSPRGGGISRKITSAADRRRLKEITAELELPRGMGLIVRTAGAARPKPEILRDCEYLLNQWDQIRELTMKSMAPTLIYEEASLIKRAIRDVYSRDVEEILVDGEQGWRAARDFMRMLMPAHAKKVQLWRDPQPLFAKAQVESQLDSMLQPTVQLRSGGYLVINQTEALVAIDVNSGRSTRERGIEETAVRTNLEAAEEAARQLRLRDLAGLIVIDFIDMESRRNNTAVEKRLKDALKNDRARIQVGSISHFGLLEMSRQRLRPSIAETNSVPCPHCGGTGHMRSTESAALAVLRAIEDEGGRRRSAEIVVHVHGSIALYVLNHKRVRLAEIEQRYGLHVTFQADDALIPPQNRIEKIRALLPSEVPELVAQLAPADAGEDQDEAVMEAEDVDADVGDETVADEMEAEEAGAAAQQPGETAAEAEQRQRKRRRRRRGSRRDEAPLADAMAMPAVGDALPEGAVESGEPSETAEPVAATAEGPEGEPAEASPGADGMGEGERKRRGRRGGRRRRREPGVGDAPAGEGEGEDAAADSEAAPEAYVPPYVPPYTPSYVPVYTGPTPANPFGGDSNAFAFFDAVEEIDPPPAPRAAPMPIEPAVIAEAEPVIPEPVAHEPVVPEPVVPEPVAVAAPEPEPAPSGPVIGPAIIPIVVGAPDMPPVEKKKGWWRR
jgi:ribonuclease E